ncbi:MAG: caspase domain-containing protein [Saprospiraceae bacterium]
MGKKYLLLGFLSLITNIMLAFNTNVYAVVIGITDYRQTNVNNLQYTENDAFKFYNLLKNEKLGAFKIDNVSLLVNQSASKANIIKAMRHQFRKAKDNDLLIFFFSGHGGQRYFRPFDEELLLHNEIKQIINQSSAETKIVFADACYAGSMLTPILGNGQIEHDTNYFGENTITLLSSGAKEQSWEDSKIKHGVFSYYLVTGLMWNADINRDYKITIQEIFNYIYVNTRQHVLTEFQVTQQPIIGGAFDSTMVITNLIRH